jgi:hypothetical protein
MKILTVACAGGKPSAPLLSFGAAADALSPSDALSFEGI